MSFKETEDTDFDRSLSDVAICARAESRFFMLDVAHYLKEKWGSRIHLYCNNVEDVKFYTALDAEGVLSSINDSGVLLDSLKEDARPDEQAIIKIAREYEQRLGITYNLLSVSDRHLGRGYALGGFRHPRSRYSEESEYIDLVHAFNRTVRYWEEQLQIRGVGLVVNGSKESAVVCRMLGIHYRTLALSRRDNLYYWAQDEFFKNSEIEAIFWKTRHIKADPVVLDKPYLSHQVMREKFRKEFRLINVTKTLILETARYIYWKVRRRKKAEGYYLRERLRHQVARWKDFRWLGQHACSRLSEINVPFVFYPLQTEPETSLQRLSPEYFFQLGAIASLARDLPAGVMLAVKETPAAVGRRPRDFYRQVRELKNVVFLDTFELGVDVVRKAEATATISGTAGFEAAVMGRRVIAFGQHNIYNFLPHVAVIRGHGDLRTALENIFSQDFDEGCAVADGVCFYNAVKACSFDMRDYDFVNVKKFDKAAVADAAEALVASVQRTDERAEFSSSLQDDKMECAKMALSMSGN